MKFFNFRLLGFLLLVMPVFIFSSCDDDDNCVRGSGDVETRELNVENFEGLRVNGSTKVFVKRGAAQRVEVKGQPNVLDAISTEVQNGVWDIEFDRCLRSHKTLEVYITVPELSTAELIGSGRIELQDEFETNEFRAVLDGSGSLKINVVASKVTSRLNGSGNIDLLGAATVQEMSLTGSGNIKAFSLLTESSGVTLTGSGNVEVNASTNLTVTISGSGNVYYQGNPSINVNISGSGKVVKR